MGNFTHVANYITKAESTPDTSDAVVLTGQLKVAAGLAHLEGKKYKQAARKFLEASPELGTSFSDVMSQQDVATYGGLCALASYDRAELKAKLIDNSPFRAFLELVPEVCACTPPAFLPPRLHRARSPPCNLQPTLDRCASCSPTSTSLGTRRASATSSGSSPTSSSTSTSTTTSSSCTPTSDRRRWCR